MGFVSAAGERWQENKQGLHFLEWFWSCAADKEWGEPHLPEQTDPGMFPCTVIFLSRQLQSQRLQDILGKGKDIFFPVVTTVWLGLPTGLGAATPFPDGISRREIPDRAFLYVACLIFQTENRVMCPQPGVNQHLPGDSS